MYPSFWSVKHFFFRFVLSVFLRLFSSFFQRADIFFSFSLYSSFYFNFAANPVISHPFFRVPEGAKTGQWLSFTQAFIFVHFPHLLLFTFTFLLAILDATRCDSIRGDVRPLVGPSVSWSVFSSGRATLTSFMWRSFTPPLGYISQLFLYFILIFLSLKISFFYLFVDLFSDHSFPSVFVVYRFWSSIVYSF